MVTAGADGRDASLSPLRRPRLPRASTALRTALVAALLATAAGVLYAWEPVACPAAGPAPPSSSSSSTPSPVPDPSRRAVPAGAVGLPVRLAEPAALAVIRPGDRVDLLALPGEGDPATEPRVVATGALVLAVPDADPAGAAALYLAVPPEAARRTSAMPDKTRFAVIVRPK